MEKRIMCFLLNSKQFRRSCFDLARFDHGQPEKPKALKGHKPLSGRKQSQDCFEKIDMMRNCADLS